MLRRSSLRCLCPTPTAIPRRATRARRCSMGAARWRVSQARGIAASSSSAVTPGSIGAWCSFPYQGQLALRLFQSFSMPAAPTSFACRGSTCGGKSGQLGDGQLAASGENICDFAPTATGSTLFAITQSDPYCYSDSTSPNYLWRSDDAGATWAQIGQLPAVATDLTVVSSGDAQPVLYLRMPVSAQYQTIQPSTTPPGLAISTDGGKTWRLAPTKGLPQGTQKNYGPLAVLSDGSIVKVFRAPDQTLTICAWKAGDAAWRSIAQQVYSNLAYLLVSSNAGKVTLWMVSLDADGSYNVTRYNQ